MQVSTQSLGTGANYPNAHRYPWSVQQAVSRFVLIPFRKGVGGRVVDKRVVTVSPGEWLGPDPQMGVRQERCSPVLLDVVVVFGLLLEAVVSREEARGDSDEEREISPRVGQPDSVVLLCFHSLREGARRAPPRALETSHTSSQK